MSRTQRRQANLKLYERELKSLVVVAGDTFIWSAASSTSEYEYIPRIDASGAMTSQHINKIPGT